MHAPRFVAIQHRLAAAQPFALHFPAPLALYDTSGVPHDANKAGAVQALLEGLTGMRATVEGARHGPRAVNAALVVVDFTQRFYSYRHVDSAGAWAEAIVNELWTECVVRGTTRLLVIVCDCGSVPEKVFENDKRRTVGGSRSPHSTEPLAASPTPPAADWAAWVGSKSTQAHLWQLVVEHVRGRQQQLSGTGPHVVLDGPGCDGAAASPLILPARSMAARDASALAGVATAS